MEQFISQHSSAIFGLLGAILGGSFSFLATWTLKNRDYSLKIWGKLLDKRIKAHENLISVALEMRVMVAGNENYNPSGEVSRYPNVMSSKEVFEDWFIHFTHLTQEGSTWLTTDARREVSYTQDYLVTLHNKLSSIPSEQYSSVGEIIRLDFINLSSELEKISFNYFEDDISSRKLNKLSDWHKYPRDETEARLMKTNLMLNWSNGGIEKQL